MAENKYVIFTDSCCDLTKEQRKRFNVEYCRMLINIDGKEEKHADLNWEEYTYPEFYGWMKVGKRIKTAQITHEEFTNSFEPWLQKGYDILFIGCSDLLSGGNEFARQYVVPDLLEKYKGRKICIYNSKAGSGAEGMVVIQAAMQRDKGLSFDELIKWLDENKHLKHQYCTAPTLSYFAAAGRIKGAKAFFGNLFNKKPIIVSDHEGNNYTVGTVTGTKNAYKYILSELVRQRDAGFVKNDDLVIVGHADCMEEANKIIDQIKGFGFTNIELIPFGPIVGSTAGPGAISIFFWGEPIPEDPSKMDIK